MIKVVRSLQEVKNNIKYVSCIDIAKLVSMDLSRLTSIIVNAELM